MSVPLSRPTWNGRRCLLEGACHERYWYKTTHSNTVLTNYLVLLVYYILVQQYQTNPRLAKVIEQHELFFIPVVSPDSYVKKSRYVHGVNPNREYPSPKQSNDSPIDCIKHLIGFFDAHDIAGSLDFHSYGRMVMYPWAYTWKEPEAKDAFMDLTSQMAAMNGYKHGQIANLIYPVSGSSADYYYRDD